MVKVLRSWVRGPLEPFAPGFADRLLSQGYSPTSAAMQLCFVAHLDRWLAAEGLGVSELSSPVLAQYLGQRCAAGYVRFRSVRALRPLMEYLTPLDVLPVAVEVRSDAAEQLLGRFGDFLLSERGMRPGTVRGYVDCVRPFVADRVRDGAVDLASIGAADITGYVQAVLPCRAVGSVKLMVTALRSLLHWLHQVGEISDSLVAAVPSVAGWRLSGVPHGLEPAELTRLLAACDRRTAVGRRNYAIMLLLVRLGLRAGEVAGLNLDDIDWRRGEIAVLGKGSRRELLPLPVDVGVAVAGYLRRGRPRTVSERCVFAGARAPHRRLTTSAVSTVVRDTARRASLGTVHAHRLRHTAATLMLRAGSPLGEIGQVLRHRSTETTAIYAKVDRSALTALARPWPAATVGGAS